uniref:Uncharacterized protein n=1 Tax=Panagrolaimus sp. PS1159 TaxID=55785 RepID=A0AC35FBK8_9BILA
MTFTTNIFVEPESPPPSYSILSIREELESLTFVETSSSTESFNNSDDSSDMMDENDPFITYQSLNDCPEQQESLMDANDSDESESDSSSSIDRENSDDSLFQMLSSVGFSIKKNQKKKRVTFKAMVKVFHFESAELAEKRAIQEAEKQRQAKIAEESKSFVSGVKFFVGNNFDNDEDDYY